MADEILLLDKKFQKLILLKLKMIRFSHFDQFYDKLFKLIIIT